MTAEYHGPFVEEYYSVTVDGYEVPNIKIRKIKNKEGAFSLTLDGRFGIDTDENELQRWLWIIANAMAISAGYSCHGEQSVIMNPFHRRLIGLSSDEFDSIKGKCE